MRKPWILLLGITVLLFTLSGCGGGQKLAQPAGEQKPEAKKVVEMRMSHAFPEKDMRAQAYQFWADEVNKRTNGAVKIKVYPSESLFKNPEIFKAMVQKSVEIGVIPSTFASTEAKELAPLDVAGLFDPKKIREVNTAITPVMQKIMAKYGLRYLWPTDEGETIIYLNKKNAREIHDPSDLKGLRIRDHGLWIGKTIKAWGGTPMTVPPSDVSVAFDRGTVDGGYTGWPFVMAFKLLEQAPNVTWIGYQNMWQFVAITEEAWGKLTPDQQKIMAEAGKDAMEHNIKLTEEARNNFEKLVTEKGGKIYRPTPEEMAKFKQALTPLHDEVAQYSGPMGKELMDALRSVK